MRNWLKQPANDRKPLAEQSFAKAPLSKDDAATARKLLWDDFVANVKKERAAEFKARVLKHGKFEMPFAYTVFGKKPKNGRSLFISMHGGGGTPKRVNDAQWENQKKLYTPKEGVYVAPRAPTDTWNMWHQGHIDPLFDRLIQDMILFEDADPNRVYLMGYSAGGDGVYQVAPRYADRLAAAAMMAGHPNDASPLGLRNIGFTLHMGGNDSAYNRNKVARQWEEKLAALKKADPNGYTHLVKIHPGLGHWMQRKDAVAVEWMAKFTRNPRPEKIVWKQDDVTHSRFYWLAVDEKNRKPGTQITATRNGPTIDIAAEGVQSVQILLDDHLLDLDKPVKITSGGRTIFEGCVQRTIADLAKSLTERSDPEFLFSAGVTVPLSAK